MTQNNGRFEDAVMVVLDFLYRERGKNGGEKQDVFRALEEAKIYFSDEFPWGSN